MVRPCRVVAWLLAACVASMAEGGAVTAGAPGNPIVPAGECVRLFHSKGDVGCHSLDKQGTRARLVNVATQDQLNGLVLAESSILIMPEALFTKANVAKFDATYTKGLLIYPPSSNATTYNLDAPSPQGAGTIDGALNPTFGNYSWNPLGRNLMGESFPYPVVQVQSADAAQRFVTLAAKNDGVPTDSSFGVVYRSLMKYYFGPPKMDSPTCLGFKNIRDQRSPKCYPVGGQSSWGVKGDLSAPKPILMAMAAMDTNAFSHVYAPGANAGASGLVALLAAADAFKSIPSSALSKHIVFAAFQAEAYGFVGSRRFLADLTAKANNCARTITATTPFGTAFCARPLSTSVAISGLSMGRIEAAIAIDQVGVGSNFSVHINPSAPTAAMQSVVDSLTKAPSALGAVAKSSVSGVPPGPLVSFLNDKEYGNASLVAAVLSGYDKAFPAAYHSRFDLNTSIDATAVTTAAQVLAEALFASAAGSGSTPVVNGTLVAEMVACITTDWSCPLMKAVSTPFVNSMIDYLTLTATSWPSSMSPVTLYAGVYSSDRVATAVLNNTFSGTVASVADDVVWKDSNTLSLFPNAYEVFTRSFLAAALGEPTTATCKLSKDCKGTDLECVYPGVCKTRAAHFHDAYSPGLEKETTPGLFKVLNANLPLWTEPNWDALGTFVYPDPRSTIGYVALGVGILAIGLGYVIAARFLAHFRKQKLL
ncbi:hypothetical protein SPRG_13132 [Saprolegnia parasitica CBS 223.65]|uniref:Nicastrin n=1 Tax=Saprolegnia parasitica (strain CBS 223.65) TaxID=695850 RepID=A0A067C5B3_SAPPC|nr:hypothetical protein SPRG_13132 [Saprolegnia parasitica CBS 223.65]KDO21716.1 hypothetical protein SPRG_13132 [Saprolegnia parasitica CBS 223.65]|eukprot:XP_012207519.1 hypothetical protein SPRG_13132 [Saprolegnia parasitica CBS 223.65]